MMPNSFEDQFSRTVHSILEFRREFLGWLQNNLKSGKIHCSNDFKKLLTRGSSRSRPVYLSMVGSVKENCFPKRASGPKQEDLVFSRFSPAEHGNPSEIRSFKNEF